MLLKLQNPCSWTVTFRIGYWGASLPVLTQVLTLTEVVSSFSDSKMSFVIIILPCSRHPAESSHIKLWESGPFSRASISPQACSHHQSTAAVRAYGAWVDVSDVEVREHNAACVNYRVIAGKRQIEAVSDQEHRRACLFGHYDLMMVVCLCFSRCSFI